MTALPPLGLVRFLVDAPPVDEGRHGVSSSRRLRLPRHAAVTITVFDPIEKFVKV